MSDKANDTIRVLVVSQLFPPESMGGAHRWHKLSRNLPNGIECRVLAPPPIVPLGMFERTHRPWKTEVVDDVPVTRLWTYQPVDDDWTGIGRVLNFVIFALFASLYVLVHGWRYDCIVTRIGPHSTFLPGLVGRMLGRSWIIDIDDMWIDNAVNLGFIQRDSIVHQVVEEFERLAFDLADGIMLITQTMAEQYAEKHELQKDTFTVVSNGIDVDQFTAGDNSTSDEGSIVYTGKLGQAQAFEPFFRGFARLEGKHELLVVGFGERRDELERLVKELGIEERVSFKGPVEREEIPAILQSAALTWVPLKITKSLDYARPTKLLETMAAGTPYIASRVAEIEAVTATSNAGKAVENEPKAITHAMRDLLSDETRRVETGRRGTEFVAENHRWDVLGDRVGEKIVQVTTNHT